MKALSCSIVGAWRGGGAGRRALCEALLRVAAAAPSARLAMPPRDPPKLPPLACVPGSESSLERWSSDESIAPPYASDHSEPARPDAGYEADVEIGKFDQPTTHKVLKPSNNTTCSGHVIGLEPEPAEADVQCPEYARSGALAHPELCLIVVDMLTELIHKVMSGDSSCLTLAKACCARLSQSLARAPPPKTPLRLLKALLSGAGADLLSTSDPKLEEAVQRFWRTEEPPMHKIKDPLDIECENLFASTTSRDSNGKYIVRLPIIPNHERLGDSRQTALKQFMSIERRMSRQPEFRDKYVEFMEEYLRLGHMVISEFDFNSGDEYYVLAHHGVFKRSGDVNKIRVVFNGTIPSSTGVCLNDCLYTGERLQNDITDIITNFRFPLVVFTCDVKMMFRQTYICPEDRRYQLIYWRSSPSEPLRVYELTTNTYGLKSSPYIAIRCLHQLAHDGKQDSPRAAELLLRNSYVDDLNGGGDSLSEALSLRDELISLMKSAGYELRKWSSNVPELLQGLPADHLETPRTFDGTDGSVFIKILGIQWDPISDGFTYRVNLPSDSTVTRRSILSMTAKLYDPLGWISPVVFRFKLLLQSVIGTSGNKVDWDSPVSDDLVRMWQDYISDLSNLERLSIPRCLRPGAQARYSLHGFCDGSSLGHAAAVYVRAELPDGSVLVRLIIAKSRLAPLKTQQTIPKMELNGAALLTTLLNHEVSKIADNIVFEEVVGWCDSTIVLAWLRTPAHTLQVFEANRVSQINASTASIYWRHVPSELNCADVSSRGAAAADLLNHELWWGPQWLCQPSDCWPADGPAFPPDIKYNARPGKKNSSRKTERPLTTCTELQRSVLELIEVVAASGIEPSELALYLKLLQRGAAPLGALLATLQRLAAAAAPHTPPCLLAFPSPPTARGGAAGRAAATLQRLAGAAAPHTPPCLLAFPSPPTDEYQPPPAPEPGQSNSQSHQAETFARHLFDQHTKAGIKSSWSSAAARCGIEGAGWGPWLQGFAAVAWLQAASPAPTTTHG
ncbi:unnamed protein product [Plutella xylostella]|uniref:(diamondback moth) hypothetical protein n=1 Tax=Plutella xylostella TaxID=51655 RepID=A0A8S4EVB1_PLUXY|nr:unnamed protein product [Plutella xylostella]